MSRTDHLRELDLVKGDLILFFGIENLHEISFQETKNTVNHYDKNPALDIFCIAFGSYCCYVFYFNLSSSHY